MAELPKFLDRYFDGKGWLVLISILVWALSSILSLLFLLPVFPSSVTSDPTLKIFIVSVSGFVVALPFFLIWNGIANHSKIKKEYLKISNKEWVLFEEIAKKTTMPYLQDEHFRLHSVGLLNFSIDPLHKDSGYVTPTHVAKKLYYNGMKPESCSYEVAELEAPIKTESPSNPVHELASNLTFNKAVGSESNSFAVRLMDGVKRMVDELPPGIFKNITDSDLSRLFSLMVENHSSKMREVKTILLYCDAIPNTELPWQLSKFTREQESDSWGTNKNGSLDIPLRPGKTRAINIVISEAYVQNCRWIEGLNLP